jgi:hypothetical protein
LQDKNTSSVIIVRFLALVFLKHLVPLLHYLLLHRRKQMAIDPKGNGNIAVPQQFLNDLDIHPHRKQERGRAMSQVVKA